MAIYDAHGDLRDLPIERPAPQAPRRITAMDIVLVLVCLAVMGAIAAAALS